jgi:hypothetical protein
MIRVLRRVRRLLGTRLKSQFGRQAGRPGPRPRGRRPGRACFVNLKASPVTDSSESDSERLGPGALTFTGMVL